MAKQTATQAAKEKSYDPIKGLSDSITNDHIGPKNVLIMYTAWDLNEPVNVNREHWQKFVDREGKSQQRKFLCLDGEEINGKVLGKDDCPVCAVLGGKQPKKTYYVPVIADPNGDDNWKVYYLRLDADKFDALKIQLESDFVGANISQVGHKFGMYKESKEQTARIVFAQGMISRDKLGKNDLTPAQIDQIVNETDWENLESNFPDTMGRYKFFDRVANSLFEPVKLGQYHDWLSAKGLVIESDPE